MGLNIEIPLLHFVEAILAFQKDQAAPPQKDMAAFQPPPELNSWMPMPLGHYAPPTKAEGVPGNYSNLPAPRMNANQRQQTSGGSNPAAAAQYQDNLREEQSRSVPRAEFVPVPPTFGKSTMAKKPSEGQLQQGGNSKDMFFQLSLNANRPMGITLDMQSKGNTGWPIRKIENGSWAQENGLEVDDRLVAINGQHVCDMSKVAIQVAMGQRPVGFKFQRVAPSTPGATNLANVSGGPMPGPGPTNPGGGAPGSVVPSELSAPNIMQSEQLRADYLAEQGYRGAPPPPPPSAMPAPPHATMEVAPVPSIADGHLSGVAPPPGLQTKLAKLPNSTPIADGNGPAPSADATFQNNNPETGGGGGNDTSGADNGLVSAAHMALTEGADDGQGAPVDGKPEDKPSQQEPSGKGGEGVDAMSNSSSWSSA
jgi:hypothetical protein